MPCGIAPDTRSVNKDDGVMDVTSQGGNFAARHRHELRTSLPPGPVVYDTGLLHLVQRTEMDGWAPIVRPFLLIMITIPAG